LLPVNEYGRLGLITTTVLLFTAVSKFGSPSSIIRFYAEYKAKKKLSSVYSSFIFGFGSITLLVGIFILIFLNITRIFSNDEYNTSSWFCSSRY